MKKPESPESLPERRDSLPPEVHEIQINIYRSMTAEQKLHIANRLYWNARALKAAWLRRKHPDWPEEKVQEEVKKAFLYART